MTQDIDRIRIATRESKLALWQAEHVQAQLQQLYPDIIVELVPMTTRGDQMLDSPLSRIGGKGLFLKELETAILEGRADIAVHSMKDVPAQMPEGLVVPIILERGDPFDAYISNDYASPGELPEGAIVGTASMRRQCQLLSRFPHLDIRTLRGNVQTRLRKLDEGQYDAIVLAAAGLKRMHLDARISCHMNAEDSLPAIGQGAIGIECREQDQALVELLAPLHDRQTGICLAAERAVNARLEGSCSVPLAGFAELEGDELHLRALLGSPDGSKVLRAQIRGPADQAATLGNQVAEQLLADGGGEILRALEAAAAHD